MVLEPAAIENNASNAARAGALGNPAAHLASVRALIPGRHPILERTGGRQGKSAVVVDHLRVYVLDASEDGQPRSRRRAVHAAAYAPVALAARGGSSFASHAGKPTHSVRYAPATVAAVLPGLRRTYSPSYRIPLPL